MEKKQPYEKPSVRAVRLEPSQSVLAVCNTSTSRLARLGTILCTVRHCYGA
jgi:hypothetical protein